LRDAPSRRSEKGGSEKGGESQEVEGGAACSSFPGPGDCTAGSMGGSMFSMEEELGT
jgi:hypothetical protein